MTMNDHDPDDAELLAWRADGKAPKGICPHCGSTVSVVERDEWFRARCSHRGCGASGPRMRVLGRAVEMFCRPPGYVERHMGRVHESSLTDVVTHLEDERDTATAVAQRAVFAAQTMGADLARIGAICGMTDDEYPLKAVERVVAEVARLRGEYERGLREAAGVLRDAAQNHRNNAEASRSVAASGGHVLAADILESYANMIDLLDAAPAAEVE